MSVTPTKPSSCIIGCGWLGLPLATKLAAEDFMAYGTTTSSEKLPVIESHGVNPILYSLGSELKLPTADTYFVNIPPSSVADYLPALQRLMDQIPRTSHLIFCSTTSVYRDTPDHWCLESDVEPGVLPDDPDLDAARHGTPRSTLILAEGIVAQHPNHLILRLAGLYGAGRHPVKYLSGRSGLSSPNAGVNLIHLHDLIEIGFRAISTPPGINVMNVCSGEHPTRKDYYTQQAQLLGITPPLFNSNDLSTGKLIDNSILVDYIGYNPPLR